jgi:molybdopterin-containing oxidoreductase family molybdopterin binding subunit
MAQVLKSYEFSVGVDIYLNDSSYFFDLVIPEGNYLERYDPMPNTAAINHHTPCAAGVDWAVGIRQPVIPLDDGRSELLSIFGELAKRAGTYEYYVGMMNALYSVKPENSVSLDEDFDIEKFFNSVLISIIDEEHGLDWLKENGVYRHPRDIDEVYLWADGSKSRIPLYRDYMLEARDKAGAKAAELGIPWDTSEYQALSEWYPCPCNEHEDEEYDIFPTFWTNSVNTDTWQVQNAYINEINEKDKVTFGIEINSATAAAKGLANGDRVKISNEKGWNVEGALVVTEAVHPQTVSVLAGSWGGKSSFMPIAKGKGVAICPTGASSVDEDGIIVIDKEVCNGCQSCITACPYGARYYRDNENGYFGSQLTEYETVAYAKMPVNTVDKCDFCKGNGRFGAREEPACVKACHADARYFGPAEEMKDMAAGKDGYQLLPEQGTGPSNWYLPNKYY